MHIGMDNRLIRSSIVAAAKNGKANKTTNPAGLLSRSMTTAGTRRAMMLHLIRLETAYQRVRQVLTVDHLAEHPELSLIWVFLQDHYKTSQAAPQKAALLAAARDALPSELHESVCGTDSNSLQQTIRDAYKLRIEDTNKIELTNWTVRTVGAFLEEKQLAEVSSMAMSTDSVPADLHAMLSEVTARLSKLKALQQTAGDDKLFPDDWQPAGVVLRPTGIPFMDRCLDGGAAAGEIHGVLGAYGSCKSTLGNMIVVEAAKQEWRRKRKPNFDGRGRLAFLFFWESAHANDFRYRALSYWGEIKLDRLRQMKDWDSLTKWPQLAPYERELFAAKLRRGDKIFGEQDRAKMAIPLLNKWTCYCDMSGADGTSFNRGAEGVEEVARTIEAKLEDRKMDGVSTVVIDYAGLMVDRYLVAHDISEDAFRHYLRRVVFELRTQVACRFKCDVWLLHQLNTEANSRTAGGVARRTDAAECKGFAEHLDFCFEIGLPTPEGLCVLSCDKHRRTEAHKPEIIQIQGDLSRVVSTNGSYVIDPITSKIESAEDFGRVCVASRPKNKNKNKNKNKKKIIEPNRTMVLE